MSGLANAYTLTGLAASRPANPAAAGMSGDNVLLYYATDTATLSFWTGSAWASVGSGGGGGSSGTSAPRGRLTLVSATPVLTSDQTAKTVIYYTPYVGTTIPLYNGSATADATFAELTLTLDTTNHVSGNLYDVFVWSNSGTISVGTGPAWSSGTSRGTGAGTTEIATTTGFWTNANSITLKNGAGAGTTGVAANTALYVGTFYATANGQTGMAFKPTAAAGGCNNVLALYNAYNRIDVGAMSQDSTATWTYSVATWRAANNSNSNRITFIDGLRQSPISASYMSRWQPNTSSLASADTGVNLDSTSAAPVINAEGYFTGSSSGSTNFSSEQFPPQLGLHYIQAMESGHANGTLFVGAGTSPTRQMNALTVRLAM